MRGALVDTSPADLVVRLAEQSATGTLTLTGHHGEASVTFVHGTVAAARLPASGALRGLRLGERLVHAGRLEADDLDRVLADQAAANAPVALGHMLVERGLVAADVVRVLLQEQALDALTALLQWQSGQYVFEIDPAPATRVRVALPVDRALVEVRRRAREADRVRERVPGPTAVPRLTDQPHAGVRLSPDAVSMLTAVDGRVSVGAIASTLGYGYDEASRILYRLALQGLVAFAGNGAERTPRRTAGAPAPAGPPSSGVPDRPAPAMPDLSPGASPTHHDEPEPWVGWAHGAPDDEPGTPAPAPSTATPHGDVDRRPAPDAAPGAPDQPPAGPTQATVDDDTRRALFSELHAVSRAEPDGSGAGDRPTPPSPATSGDGGPTADDDRVVEDESAEAPVAPAESSPAARALPDLSGDEVSSLLRELHDLNRDEE